MKRICKKCDTRKEHQILSLPLLVLL